MPVDLISFTGKKVGKETMLRWEIANPENVFGYEIERTSILSGFGNLEWNSIGFESHDDTREVYQFLDRQPNYGENYYRLRMIDFDGSFSYSNIIQFDFSTAEKDRAIFFPNPAFDSVLKLELNTETADLVTIEIIDGLARTWANIILYSDGNRLILPIDISKFSGGIYFAKIKMGNRRLNRSFVVVRD